jgi:hypothetical protein
MTLIDFANPTKFLSLTARVLPWLAGATAILLLIGFYQAAMAPDDYQHGAVVKIMFIHVPNAWLSMFVWSVMSLAALGTLVWRHPLADVAAKAAAPIGAAFTFLALDGLLWAPMRAPGRNGCDSPLVLVLFLMYLGLMALWRAWRSVAAARAAPDAGRRAQPADHHSVDQEHAIAGVVLRGRTRSTGVPDSIAGDGGRLFAAVRHPASGGDAQRDPAPARAQLADDASQPAGGMT